MIYLGSNSQQVQKMCLRDFATFLGKRKKILSTSIGARA